MQPRQVSPLGLTVIFILLLLLASLVGNWHYAAALTDEAIEKERRPKLVAEMYGKGQRPDLPQRLVLINPTDCDVTKADATVNQRVFYISPGITRCYTKGEL